MRDIVFTPNQASVTGFDVLMASVGPGDADIRLEPGTYYTAGQPDGSSADAKGMWAVRSGWRIRGTGNEPADVTIAVKGPYITGKKWHVMGTDFHSVCNFRLENLTLDCGFRENPSIAVNHSGLVVRGSNNTLKGVRVVNWGSRMAGSECFGLGMIAVHFDATNNVIEDCSVIEPGGDQTATGMTGILHSALPPYRTLHPVIKNCVVSNLGGNQSAYANGYTFYNSLRSSLEGCYASDVGAAVYMDDAGGSDLNVRHCHFERVRRGVSAAFYRAGTRQDAVTIEGCRIGLIDPTEGAAFGIELKSFEMSPDGFGIIKISGNEVICSGAGVKSYLAAVRGAEVLIVQNNCFVSDNPVTPLIGRNNGKVLLSRNLLGQGGVISYFNEITHETVADPV